VEIKLSIMNLRQSQDLIKELNTHFSVDITKKSRVRHLVDIRHCAMFSLRKRQYGLNFIGEIFDQNHASVIHAVKKVNALYGLDKDYTKLSTAIDEVIDNFFEKEKIYSRTLNAEKYEALQMAACRLISEYVTNNQEIESWLLRMGLTWDQYRTFTSRQL